MAEMAKFAAYSLADVSVTFSHPDLGSSTISDAEFAIDSTKGDISDYSAVLSYDKNGKKVATRSSYSSINLSEASPGRITISFSADMSSQTASAGGYVVVNKIKANAGTVGLEMPQNSAGDVFLRKWCKYLKNCKVQRFALAELFVQDSATGHTYHCEGVTPQKMPDVTYDQAAGSVQYTLLCAYITYD